MNIAFFGTSDRSVPILNSLKDSEFDLVLCITKADVKVGRKQKLKPTGVKKWCEVNGVQYVTVDSLKGADTAQTAGALKSNNIELGVVADFSFIIPEEIFTLPKHGIVNIHFSLLPIYRGASPVQFAILNQDKKTGVTYLIVGKGLDSGPILHKTEYKLTGTETSGRLYETLFELTAEKLPKVLKNYVEGKIKPKKQDKSKVTYTYSPTQSKKTSIFKEDAKIHWDETPEEIDALVRAFTPWPIAWTTLKEFKNLKKDKNGSLRVKIYETAVENDKLIIKTIQVEGKNKGNWKEFENGYLDSAESSATDVS